MKKHPSGTSRKKPLVIGLILATLIIAMIVAILLYAGQQTSKWKTVQVTTDGMTLQVPRVSKVTSSSADLTSIDLPHRFAVSSYVNEDINFHSDRDRSDPPIAWIQLSSFSNNGQKYYILDQPSTSAIAGGGVRTDIQSMVVSVCPDTYCFIKSKTKQGHFIQLEIARHRDTVDKGGNPSESFLANDTNIDMLKKVLESLNY